MFTKKSYLTLIAFCSLFYSLVVFAAPPKLGTFAISGTNRQTTMGELDVKPQQQIVNFQRRGDKVFIKVTKDGISARLSLKVISDTTRPDGVRKIVYQSPKAGSRSAKYNERNIETSLGKELSTGPDALPGMGFDVKHFNQFGTITVKGNEASWWDRGRISGKMTMISDAMVAELADPNAEMTDLERALGIGMVSELQGGLDMSTKWSDTGKGPRGKTFPSEL